MSRVLTNPLVVNAPVPITTSNTFVSGVDPIKKLPLFTILVAVVVKLAVEFICTNVAVPPVILGAVNTQVTSPLETLKSVPLKVTADKTPVSITETIMYVAAID